MNTSQVKKATLLLGVASVATSVGNVAVKAGPALQTLNNLTNTSEFSINNTYGQSFSVDGITSVNVLTSAGGPAMTVMQPFRPVTALASVGFNAGSATLTTGFGGTAFGGGGFQAVGTVRANASLGNIIAPLTLNNTASSGVGVAGGLTNLRLQVGSATQTIGASISSTTFGPNTVKATSSFTNQLINDLSAF